MTVSQNGAASALTNLFSAPTDSRGHLTEGVRDAFMSRMRAKPENRTCFDCPSRNPTWMSLTYGVLLCLNCSGKHRRMGVHISFVRSCDLDMFTPEQLTRMELGGNASASDFFRKNGVSSQPLDYSSKLVERYRKQLDAKVAEYRRSKSGAVTGGTDLLVADEENPAVSCASTSCASPGLIITLPASSPGAVSTGSGDAAVTYAAAPQLASSSSSSSAAAAVPAAPSRRGNHVETTPEKFVAACAAPAAVGAAAAAVYSNAPRSLTFSTVQQPETLRAKKLGDDVDFDELFASAQALQ